MVFFLKLYPNLSENFFRIVLAKYFAFSEVFKIKILCINFTTQTVKLLKFVILHLLFSNHSTTVTRSQKSVFFFWIWNTCTCTLVSKITFPKDNRFSQFFHYWKQDEILNKTYMKFPRHLKYVTTLPDTLWNM